jgi:hypothetical protein
MLVPLFPSVRGQIGLEKHRMLNLFMQVPGLVRKRLAKRCKEVYEYMVMAQAVAEEGGDDDDMPQVLRETRGQGWDPVLCAVCVSERV